MVVGGDEWCLWNRNEGGVDDDFYVGEVDSCRCVWGKERDESVEQTLVENGYHSSHHCVPVMDAVRVAVS